MRSNHICMDKLAIYLNCIKYNLTFTMQEDTKPTGHTRLIKMSLSNGFISQTNDDVIAWIRLEFNRGFVFIRRFYSIRQHPVYAPRNNFFCKMQYIAHSICTVHDSFLKFTHRLFVIIVIDIGSQFSKSTIHVQL